MSCTLNKPKVKPGCTLTKGIPCTLNKPLIPNCANVKQMLVQCKLTKPYCKPTVKMKPIPCPVKPACKPTVKMKPIPCPVKPACKPMVKVKYDFCPTLIKPRCKPGMKPLKPICPPKPVLKPIDQVMRLKQNQICVTVKQKTSGSLLCRLNKPKICTGLKPKISCISKPNNNCRLVLPKCPSVLKPTQIRKNSKEF